MRCNPAGGAACAQCKASHAQKVHLSKSRPPVTAAIILNLRGLYATNTDGLAELKRLSLY